MRAQVTVRSIDSIMARKAFVEGGDRGYFNE